MKNQEIHQLHQLLQLEMWAKDHGHESEKPNESDSANLISG